MHGLTERQVLLSLVALALILLTARAFGELARRLRQPEVLGELFGGVVLGPSVVGALAPGFHRVLFQDPAVGVVLSGISWIGALVLLLMAGIEVDVSILRKEARPGALSALGAIGPPLAAGAAFSVLVLDRPLPSGLFLGIVLSVTAVSVIAKVLIERESMRRSYAQVTLAAGVVSEVAAWVLVAMTSSSYGASPAQAVARSALLASGFLLFMALIGRRLTHVAMRWVADATRVSKGQVSLVLVLTFLAAALTQRLGLHPLLGAFAFGVLLNNAPRTNRPLLDGIQTLVAGLFAPVFFVLAGMRVDVSQLRTPTAWGMVALLLVIATAAKVVPAALGARLGGLRSGEAALVAVGLNMKGGTDLIVAIVGVELGLLSNEGYTMYAVVALVTVTLSPALLLWLEKKTPPSPEESTRLESEEAARRAYIPGVERILVPIVARALPGFATDIVESIVASKRRLGETVDITELAVEQQAPGPSRAAGEASRGLARLAARVRVGISRQRRELRGSIQAILRASRDHDLLVIGARPPARARGLSFGRLQDAIIQRAESNVLVVVGDPPAAERVSARRILVPIIGLEYSFAAADLAAHVALAWDAELVLLSSAQTDVGAVVWRDRDPPRVRAVARRVVDEAVFRGRRLGLRVSSRVHVGAHPSDEIAWELARAPYDLLVLGCYDHGPLGRLYLGSTVESVVVRSRVPVALLVAHGGTREQVR
ncbi:cation:proton antiporter domain-containing protein [Sorangium sp. So ce1000]|uniref:cation:proton antiporter domain-containing protein n=1 Tax=Sorangium sp. So ce1000 TaxID=3133325 RepID=UPI003F647EE0